ncbi:unnamed protein product, partial [Meganyctiphanes norvegica]
MPGVQREEEPVKGCPPAPAPLNPPSSTNSSSNDPTENQTEEGNMSPEDAPSTSPLAGEEGPGPLIPPQQQGGTSAPSSASGVALASPPAAFNLTCMTCHTHFTSAEEYTRHHCVSSESRGQQQQHQEDHNDSSSDVEKWEGKIVYNPDGSAYIIDSEMSDDECGLDLPRHEGAVVDSSGNPMSTTAAPTIPTIANAIYVTKNPAFYNALYGQTFTSLVQENKVPDVPIVHNYRVITVGDKDGENECKDSDSKNDSSSEKTKLPLLDYSQVPIKPILMCFVCKLSFGYVKSFIAHAMGDHSIVLMDEEKDLLAGKNASAIIQCGGREKEPRVSFLEPVKPPSVGANSNNCSSSTSSSSGCNNGRPAEALATLLPSGVPSGPSSSPQQQQQQPSPVIKIEDQHHNAAVEEDHPSNEVSIKREVTDFYDMVRQQQQRHLEQQRQQQQFLQQHHQQQQHLHAERFPPPPHPAAVRTPDLSRKSPISALGANGRASVSPVTSMSPTTFSPHQSQVSQLTGTIIGACPEHMQGRPHGVTCDKCDMILQQSRSLGGQMAFMHSRNSCKTLKCPKCNWHYKYQETLEIHMKEKHPETESTCIYCLTNQAHPRLARGETYTCGYKPYRCEVCNYSTTTKGNLSIHMQSDKHLNNMQELQNGGMPLDSSMSSPGGLPQPQQSPVNSIYSAPKTPTPSTTPAPSQQQAQQKPKPVWRCDVCNYETNVARNLRIHMTSEKHTHNMMVLQQNVKHMQQLNALQGGGGGPAGQMDPMTLLQMAGNPAAAAMMAQMGMGEKPPLPEAALADMAYNQALLIQMISGGQLPGGLMGPGGPGGHGGPGGLPGPGSVSGDHPGPQFDLGLSPESLEPPPEPVPPNPRHSFSCCVCSVFSTDSLEQLSLHLQMDRSKLNEAEVLLVVAGNYICKLCSYKTNLKANFQLHCKTDKHLQKLQHVNHILEGGPHNEWKLKYLSNTNPMHVRCNLCEYYTNSVHKLQLHAAHQRHEVLALLFRHLCMSEQSISEERRQYTCTLCSFSTKAKVQLLHHIRSMRHLQMEQLHQIQRHAEGKGQTQQDIGDIFRVEEADEDSRRTPVQHEVKEELRSPDQVHACPFCQFTCESEGGLQQHVDALHGGEKKAGLCCPLCEEACPDMTTLEKHAINVHSVNSDGLQRLLLLVRLSAAARKEAASSAATADGDENSDAATAAGSGGDQKPPTTSAGVAVDVDEPGGPEQQQDKSSPGEQEESCTTCGAVYKTVEDLVAHQVAQGHTPITTTPRGQGYLCWKKGCNQYFSTAPSLHTHFKEIHGAAPRPSVAVSERHVYKYRCQQCSLAFKTVEKLHLHAQYHAIRDATKCLLCHRNFRSLGALQKHVGADHPELSTTERTQFQASVFGAPVGAGAAPVLNPNTTALLRRESNKDDDVEEIQRIDDPPLPPQQQAVEDYLNSDTMALDNYSDPTRRYKCHRCRVAYTRQIYLTSHQKTLLHRRGEKLTYPMEKYLDPNRPFKCDVCKESFTQKNILLVHYNSVSHLHKLKKTMQEKESLGSQTFNQTQSEVNTPDINSSSIGIATSVRSEDEEINKPYRCHVCRVAYSQQTTLDIHLRSVLHQTRASRYPDLVASCQVDKTRLHTEHHTSNIPAHNASRSSSTPLSNNSSLVMSLQQQPQKSSPSEISSQGSCGRCGGVWSTPEQGAQHAIICGMLTPYLASHLPNSVNSTASVPSAALDAGIFWAAQSDAAASSSMLLPPTQPQDRSLSPSECSIESLSTSRFTVPFRKSSRLHKHLLESFGFDQVIQYIENEKEIPSENISNDQSKIESKLNSNSDLPELSKSICKHCHKEFSSIWVLKTHLEEIHNAGVSCNYLKSFSNEYKKDYLSKHSNIKESSALPDADERGGQDAEATEGGEKSTSDEREKEAESGSRSDTAATPTPTSRATPTPGATPTSSSAEQPGISVPQIAEMAAALNALSNSAQLQQQLQFNPMSLMANLGLAAGLPMPGLNPLAAMNLHPPLMPMMPHHMFDPAALAGMNQGGPPTSMASNMPGDVNPFIKQQILQQQQHQQTAAAAAAAAAAAQQKRARTRITDEQLKILRAHFDINNSPTEEQINDMAQQSGLPPKVIKHWFRNTLFKERQRSKDSPYNFSIPPSTTLNLEEYEKTGETKVTALNPEEAQEIVALNRAHDERLHPKDHREQLQSPPLQQHSSHDNPSVASPLDKVPSLNQDNSRVQVKSEDATGGFMGAEHHQHLLQQQSQNHMRTSPHLVSSASSSPLGLPPTTSYSSLPSPQHPPLTLASLITSQLESNPILAHTLPHTSPTVPNSGLIPPSSCVSPNPSLSLSYPTSPLGPNSAAGKRANRTRFTDYQIKVLQEFFENNAYPKDDDLEYLSKLLNLSPRVIVVWFQNARQKARKVYENQPPIDPMDEGAGRFTRTPGLNYQCKKCLLVFQRYYELIRHQKTHCFKEEDAKRSAQAQAAAAQAAAMYQDENSNHSSITETSQQSGIMENKPPSEGNFQCDKCSLLFHRFEQWREHQIVHLMNPALFLNKGADSPFSNMQQSMPVQPLQQQQSQVGVPQPLPSPLLPPASPIKRKLEECLSEEEREGGTLLTEAQRDKRLRTTILPEQLDYLYQKYQMEANPSRKMLETIAQEVGLKKRVVQVWFQNTRARERKGQFRAHSQVINKKCPFCPAIFKVKSALESHLSTKHTEQYSKGNLNIDALPDVEDSGVGYFGLSSTPSSTQVSQVIPSSLFSSSDIPEDSISRYHEEAIRRYLNDVNLAIDGVRHEGESPLDLSKPLGFEGSLLDTSLDHTEDHSDEDGVYNLEVTVDPDGGEVITYVHESGPSSPASSTTGSAKQVGNTPGGVKRYRTQMSAIQVKLMKSVFYDYKTPTMAECELLGREIGLAKRVVQVWFQNARAKEKKAKLALQKMLGTEPEGPKPPEECKVCNFKYSHKYAIQDHIFTRSHIESMKLFLEKAKEEHDAGLGSGVGTLGSGGGDGDQLTSNQAAGLAHQLQMAQLMALGSPPNAAAAAAAAAVAAASGEDTKVSSSGNEDLSRLQLLQQMYQMGLGGLQGAPHPLLQHAMMAGAGE